MKRFMYFSVGVLCLMVSALIGFHLGSQSAQASGVFPVSGIVALTPYGQVLDANGQAWNLWNGIRNECWTRSPTLDVPMPVDQVKLWTTQYLVTTDNIGWHKTGSTAAWVNCGPWPGEEVPTDENTWGGIKGLYEGKK